jgi:hypothetical protein
MRRGYRVSHNTMAKVARPRRRPSAAETHAADPTPGPDSFPGEMGGLEPEPCLPAERAESTAARREAGEAGRNGAKRARTADLLGAIQALSQLSYSPVRAKV